MMKDDINDSICQSKQPRLPETIIPPSKGIGSSAADDNMIQERDIHSRGGFPELPSELNIRSTR
jgi:hypothetical protein